VAGPAPIPTTKGRMDMIRRDTLATFVPALLATLFAVLPAPDAGAQTKVLPGETATITATVEAVEASTRTVTLKGPKGNYVDVVAPDTVTKFDQIKVGDTITARYYENVVLRVKRPGEQTVDSDTAGVTPGGSTKPGVTSATQRTITATITEIDNKTPSITFTGPNDWKYSSKVQDREALAKVKVGDRVDITWTSALLISFDAAK
jgi:hypothetical protein